MTVREQIEITENGILSQYACTSVDAKGTHRERQEEKCPYRTEFQRDRDRILHCNSFRRLKRKTQVFLSPVGDHYRTRHNSPWKTQPPAHKPATRPRRDRAYKP